MMKLTKRQREVMALMSKGCEAKQTVGMRIDINGRGVCRIGTINQLVKAGLVEQSGHWTFRATLAGLAWSPAD